MSVFTIVAVISWEDYQERSQNPARSKRLAMIQTAEGLGQSSSNENKRDQRRDLCTQS